MQAPLPLRRERTYNVGFGGAYLSDGDLDLGLAQASLAVDFDLGGGDVAEGLGGARLGPRFRLIGEVSTGLFGESDEAGGFRSSVGVGWSAIGLAGIALPVGDAEPGDIGTGFTLFGAAGYGFARFGFELEGPGVDISEGDTEDFFALAAGAEIFLDDRNGFRIGYTRWDDLREDGISANLFSLSYVRRFGGGE
jgi:outer membrane immunogenic protein